MIFHSRSDEHARRARIAGAVFFVVTLLLTLAFASAAASDWQGRVYEQDGITVIENPATPLHAPRTVVLEERWRIGGDSEDENEFFGVIQSLRVDEKGQVYLLDSQLFEVKVFDEDGNFLRSFGREGEAPGEFRQGQDMALMPDGKLAVLNIVPGRIVQLSREGEPADDIPLPVIENAGFLILLSARSRGEQLYLLFGYNHFEEDMFSSTRRLARIDHAGNIVADYCMGLRHIDFKKPVVEEIQWDGFENRWALGPDGRVYVAETWGEYAVSVWSESGDREMTITREQPVRMRSQAEKDRLAALYEPFIREVPGGSPGIEDSDHPITQVHVRPDGSLWVLNCFGAFDRADGSIGTFDVYDRDGRFQQQVTLMGEGDPMLDGYLFEGDRLYVLKGFMDAAVSQRGGADAEAGMDEEAEAMAVICYDMNDALLAVGRAD